MQVYRGLDIGTAKPLPEELRGVPHHLLDIVDPDEPFDASRFIQEADKALMDIASRGRPAILVGGTGLYIRALLHGLHGGPPPDATVRENILKRAGEQGWPALHLELGNRDPKSAARLHPNDGVRILRALEVIEASGITMGEWQDKHAFAEKRYEFEMLCLNRPREELNWRIEARVDEMMQRGFLAEVQALLKKGYGPELKPMQGLGYRRLTEHLQGQLSLEEAVEKIKIDTRRFAKRQVTWFKKEPNARWTEPDADSITEMAIHFFKEQP
jgi:tRNA dimethylallyltransferase